MNINSSKSGFGLVEIIIGLAIILISLFSLMAVLEISFQLINKSSNNIKASFLLEEGIEAVKILRDSGWTANIVSLDVGTVYYLNFSGSTWQSTAENTYIDGVFERSFMFEDVFRDANDDIAAGGVLDPDTKKVSVSVSWREKSSTTTQSVIIYLTNLFSN